MCKIRLCQISSYQGQVRSDQAKSGDEMIMSSQIMASHASTGQVRPSSSQFKIRSCQVRSDQVKVVAEQGISDHVRTWSCQIKSGLAK